MNTKNNDKMKETIFLLLASLYPKRLLEKFSYYKNVICSYNFASQLAACGKGTRFADVEFATGLSCIIVGSQNIFLPHLFLTAWGDDGIKLTIGNRCSIGAYCHISASNKISIGNNVLIGKWVTIVDNNHGTTDFSSISIPPYERKLVSKGPIIIEDNVWIGDKVTILSGVTIGSNSVIAANSVVTKDIPAYCVAAGNPAKIIKNVING